MAAISPFMDATPAPFEFIPNKTQDSDLLKLLGDVPGIQEWLMLRQVHALEHATVWVLGESLARRRSRQLRHWATTSSAEGLGGMSTSTGFYLYGAVQPADVNRAVRMARWRLIRGEWDLAIHPRCGTNLSVEILLTAAFALGSHLAMPRGLVEQLIGVGMATSMAAYLSPEVGGWVQRYITTAIPFNLAIADIYPVQSSAHTPTHFVNVQWIEPPD